MDVAHKHILSLRRLKQSKLEFKASFPFKTLEIEHRALTAKGKCSTTELHLPPMDI